MGCSFFFRLGRVDEVNVMGGVSMLESLTVAGNVSLSRVQGWRFGGIVWRSVVLIFVDWMRWFARFSPLRRSEQIWEESVDGVVQSCAPDGRCVDDE